MEDKNEKRHLRSVKNQFGAKAEVRRTDIPVRTDFNNMIDITGKDITPPGMSYKGSITIFLYTSNQDLIKREGGEIATATNFTGNHGIGLTALRAMLDAAKVDIIKHFVGGRVEETETP